MVALSLCFVGAAQADTFEERFAAPDGFQRVKVDSGSFGAWLRHLPLKAGKPAVLLFDGREKKNQSAHLAVADFELGKRDLQQCADAVMRLRAEYLWSVGKAADICFHLTSGEPLAWAQWNAVKRKRGGFKAYLDQLYAFAGTASLARFDLANVRDSPLQPGEVFIVGGYPGHAVLVVDVVENDKGERRFALVQSYMPAQDIHVLDNPAHPGQPWYEWNNDATLVTPEWTFPVGSLRRFKPARDCLQVN